MASDGPVTPTLQEMKEPELRKLWLAVKEIQKHFAPLLSAGGDVEGLREACKKALTCASLPDAVADLIRAALAPTTQG